MANESLYKKRIIRNINKLKNIIIMVKTILMINLFIQFDILLIRKKYIYLK